MLHKVQHRGCFSQEMETNAQCRRGKKLTSTFTDVLLNKSKELFLIVVTDVHDSGYFNVVNQEGNHLELIDFRAIKHSSTYRSLDLLQSFSFVFSLNEVPK